MYPLPTDRLEYDSQPLCLERSLSIGTILALRVLYGSVTYLDNAGRQPSPAGTYADFLGLIDDKIRESLRPEHAFDFMESIAGHCDGPCSLIILSDELNAANLVGVGCCPAWRRVSRS